MNGAKFDGIIVELTEHDLQKLDTIITKTRRALRKGGIPQETIFRYTELVEVGPRSEILTITRQWVTVTTGG